MAADEALFSRIDAMSVDREGTMTVEFADGRTATLKSDRPPLQLTSAIARSTILPGLRCLHLETVRSDHLFIDLPSPGELAPIRGRPSIYLDQNHWSTLTDTIHAPERVPDDRELAAARRLIELSVRRRVIFPMSAAHMSETCKQADSVERYRRALTIAQLSAGWQLRDPLALRDFELRQALCMRYQGRCLLPSAAVTLEPDVLHAGRGTVPEPVAADLPEDARWAVQAIRSIGAIVDTMLDAEHVPMPAVPGWTAELQRFAAYLADHPTGPEMKRRRTHAKFLADLRLELAGAEAAVGITPNEVSDWTLHRSQDDLAGMPALALFREVLHEKLSNGPMAWEDNDLIDMMYLTAAAGYCDHVVGERRHLSYIDSALRRLGRSRSTHRNLRSLLDHLAEV